MGTSLFFLMANAGAFGCAAACGHGAYESLARARAAAALQPQAHREGTSETRSPVGNALDAARPIAAYYLRNGFESFAWAAQGMRRIPPAHASLQAATRLLVRRGHDTSEQSLASLFAAACVGVAACTLVIFRSVGACVLAPVCLTLVLAYAISRGHDKEQEALREQVPDALRCMEACLHAGLSLPQAFYETALETPQPAKDAFMRVSRDLELGYSVSEALGRFHQQSGIPELAFVAMALDVQYACGGSATPILRSAEESVAKGLELRRSLRVQTAQARLSAQVVSLMPVLLLFVLSAISPGYFSSFFASTEGVALFACALFMEAAGIVCVSRTLAMEV